MYCGSEHYYSVFDKNHYFQNTYKFSIFKTLGIPWNYIIWKIKFNKFLFRNDLIFTVPSKWMYNRAKSSSILKDKYIFLLPNPINIDVFKPSPTKIKQLLRKKYNLESNVIVFLFGAVGGKKNSLKGADYLEKAIGLLKNKFSKEEKSKIVFIDFGGGIKDGFLHGFRNISIGYVMDSKDLSILYSSVDCTIVPSLVEAFGQVAAESLSCKTPVICFNSSGLTDIVHDEKSGFFAEPFSTDSLAEKIYKFIFIPKKIKKEMGEFGRNHIENNFSYDVVRDSFFKILLESKRLKKKYYEG